MSTSIEEQWQELCKQFDKARDAYMEAMSDRTPGIYHSAEFWEHLKAAEDPFRAARHQLDEFRKKYPEV